MNDWESQIRECNNIDWNALRNNGIPLKEKTGTPSTNRVVNLTEKIVLEMRRAVYSGEIKSAVVLAGMYDITVDNARRIVKGSTWKHLPFNPDFKFATTNKLHGNEAKDIRAKWNNRNSFPVSQKQLANEYNVSQGRISRIVNESL